MRYPLFQCLRRLRVGIFYRTPLRSINHFLLYCLLLNNYNYLRFPDENYLRTISRSAPDGIHWVAWRAILATAAEFRRSDTRRSYLFSHWRLDRLSGLWLLRYPIFRGWSSGISSKDTGVKLLIMGVLDRVRSSRRLARNARENVVYI
jgi:hypothetical protein